MSGVNDVTTTNGETDWMRYAKCREQDTSPDAPKASPAELFVVAHDDEPEPPYPSKDAMWYCNRCPVRTECLDDALANNYDGIWGGLSEYQRRQIKRKYARDVCPSCTSDLIVQENRSELCLACGTSWNAF